MMIPQICLALFEAIRELEYLHQMYDLTCSIFLHIFEPSGFWVDSDLYQISFINFLKKDH